MGDQPAPLCDAIRLELHESLDRLLARPCKLPHHNPELAAVRGIILDQLTLLASAGHTLHVQIVTDEPKPKARQLKLVPKGDIT